ncbi:MAG: site-specific integrase [Bdellovibrionales bacterium]|nr:site-specific integrase [Bdellovibrionales bacterium]
MSMKVIPCVSKDGSLQFQIKCDVRSSSNRNIRVTRVRSGFSSETSALTQGKVLLRSCQERVRELEIKGATIEGLIAVWIKHLAHTQVATDEIGSKYVFDARGTLRKWLRPYLHVPSSDFSSYMLGETIRRMKVCHISNSQLTKFRRMVRDLFEFAVAYGHVPPGTKSPTSELKIKKTAEFVPEILSHTEIVRLLEVATRERHPWRHVWALALLTGMRAGELYALEWSDLDLENKLIRVSKSYQTFTGIVKSTKAGYWRDIPISEELMGVLDDLRAVTSSESYVVPRFPEMMDGRQAKVLRIFCEKQGLPSIRFHTLRACFATQLLRQGVEAVKVMKVCGWRDLSTMQRYVRLAGVEVQGVTDKLSLLPRFNLGAQVVPIRGV